LIPGFFRGSIQPFVKFFGVQQEAILRGASVLGIKNEIDRFLASYEVFSEEEIFRLISVRDRISRERLHYFYDLLECRSKNSSVEAMMALDARLNLADDLLNYTDKITMNFSLECRVPMLDLELVRFIGAVPTGQKLNMLEGKLIHKKFAQSILPQKIISRKKRGFQSPTNQWFKKEIKSIGDILLAPGTHFSMVFSRFGVEAILNQHAKGYNKEKQIFLFLSIYFWLESIKQ
jgi:asparagine synthase (glutamine-hydrolysing)